MKKFIPIIFIIPSFALASLASEVDNERYISYPNQYVKDTWTNLLFQDSPFPIHKDTRIRYEFTFNEAKEYCSSLDINGIKGFRLPSITDIKVFDKGITSYKQFYKLFQNAPSSTYLLDEKLSDHNKTFTFRPNEPNKWIYKEIKKSGKDLGGYPWFYKSKIRCISGPIHTQQEWNEIINKTRAEKIKAKDIELFEKFKAEAQKENSPIPLQNFIKDYPDSELIEKAQQEIHTVYQNMLANVVKSNSLEAFINLEKQSLPEDIKIELDAKFFEKVRNLKNFVAYRTYFNKTYNDVFVPKAKQDFYTLAEAKNNLFAYQYIFMNLPDSSYRLRSYNKIADMVFQQAKDINTIEAYNSFILAFPVTPYVEEAQKLATKLEKEKYTDLSMWDSVFNKSESMEKNAKKLILTAQQFRPNIGMFNINLSEYGKILIQHRIYSVLKASFTDTNAALTFLGSPAYFENEQLYKSIMKTIHKVQESYKINGIPSADKNILIPMSDAILRQQDNPLFDYYSSQLKEWNNIINEDKKALENQ